MKKEYETPKAERVEFDYSEAVAASGNCTGGIYLEFKDGYTHCADTKTENWVNPYGNQ